jgi:CHAT domain-containing protein/predicted negative regulator of RcsB-dependent stress response
VPTTNQRDSAVASQDELLRELALLRRRSAQNRFLNEHPELFNAETVAWLSDLSRDQAKVDTASALPLAELALAVANKLKEKSAQARGLRAMGNALYASGQNAAAIEYHQEARLMFLRAGNRKEVARTLSASIQPLILTGQYDRALANAKQARRILTSLHDAWRLARLDLNTGNIFHRQDRFEEALKWYRRAHRYFFVDAEKDPEAMGVALHNIAMCLVSLNDFHGAFAAHEEARAFADKHDMRVLVAQADYNIAALHYLRGDHSRAIRMLLESLAVFQKTNDSYHVGLCRLDLSEIYLQLNLAAPAEEMAQEASADFLKLGMKYEAGKSLVNLALAMARQNKSAPALEMLISARRQFVKEKNSVWPLLTDLYRAAILTEQGHFHEAQRLCLRANRFFDTAGIPSKLVLGRLLLARSYLLAGQLQSAQKQSSLALALLKTVELPDLACEAEQLMGKICFALGLNREAYSHYEQARELLEGTRSGLHSEEFKMSFMENKLEIYEGLVQLCLQAGDERNLEEAFEHIERSKSRSLQDLMSVADAPESPNLHSEAQNKVRDLRAEVNWYSRRLEEEQLRGSESSTGLLSDLKAALHKRENDLLRLTREMSASEAASVGLASSKAATLAEIRESLPADATLVEYFQIQDRLLAVVLTAESLEILPVSTLGNITPLLDKLQFQFAKFRLGPEYVSTFGVSLLKTTRQHLKSLHDELLGPLGIDLKGKHLVIVPHGPLHRLPFQALYDGERYLIDKFTVSYAPSATVHSLCHRRSSNNHGLALVMGVPDATAPLILDEAMAVANIIPGAELLLGENATAAVLQKKGSRCRLIHIATHGYYRQDSPMFSGIRLGDSILSLYDLYRFKLPADLITLSGCATGVNTVAGGDELLGLVRGLIYAGARAALLTLWDVQDRSTLDFMTCFYGNLADEPNKAVAVQKAVWQVRDKYPHPYYWAPFNLIGNLLS